MMDAEAALIDDFDGFFENEWNNLLLDVIPTIFVPYASTLNYCLQNGKRGRVGIIDQNFNESFSCVVREVYSGSAEQRECNRV